MCLHFDHKYLLTEIYTEEIIHQIYKNKCKTMFTEAFITTQKNKLHFFCLVYQQQEHFLQGTSLVFPVVKNLPTNAGDIRDVGSNPGWRRSPGEGNGNPLQYSRLESPMDRGSWWATVHGVLKSRTRLTD